MLVDLDEIVGRCLLQLLYTAVQLRIMCTVAASFRRLLRSNALSSPLLLTAALVIPPHLPCSSTSPHPLCCSCVSSVHSPSDLSLPCVARALTCCCLRCHCSPAGPAVAPYRAAGGACRGSGRSSSGEGSCVRARAVRQGAIRGKVQHRLVVGDCEVEEPCLVERTGNVELHLSLVTNVGRGTKVGGRQEGRKGEREEDRRNTID